MPNAANVNFSITNLTQTVGDILSGVTFVEGVTKRGPFADPQDIITNFTQFTKLFGGLIANSDFPLLCKRMLDRGVLLRVSRVGHYTDPTDDSTLDAVKASINKVITLTFDAALITANQVDMDVNGTPITSIVFATNSNDTMAALATEIATNANVNSAIVVDVGAGTDDDRVIMIFPASGTAVTVTSATVTLGASQATIAIGDSIGIVDINNNILFLLPIKHEGVDYNNITVAISAASNGSSDFFNLTITHINESDLTETYVDLKIIGQPTVAESDYLNVIELQSSWVDVTYQDLSSLSGQLRPLNNTYHHNTGSDGTSPLPADFIGDSAARTGFNAFDPFDEAFEISAPEISDNAVHIAGDAYASNRKDLQYFAHLSNVNNTRALLIAARDLTNIDSKFTNFYAGGIKIIDHISCILGIGLIAKLTLYLPF